MAPFEGFARKDIRGENNRAEDEAGELSGHHSENLYDQNEDGAGEKVNLATGRQFVNDNDTVEAARNLMHAVEPGERDALPPIEEEDDAAAKWLRENGG